MRATFSFGIVRPTTANRIKPVCSANVTSAQEQIEQHEADLLSYATKAVEAIPGVSLIGTVDDDKPGPEMRDKVGVYEKAGYPNYPAPDADGYPARVRLLVRAHPIHRINSAWSASISPSSSAWSIPLR